MQAIIKVFLLVFFIASVFWRCTETKEVDPGNLGTNYFPLKVGEYRIYQVEGIRYNSFLDSVNFAYLLKESVTDSFTNLESGITYKIQRLKKSSQSGPWVLDSLWTARKDDRTAVLVESNVPLVKLSFPLEDSLTWDGNKLNDMDIDVFTMINVNQPFEDDFGSYANTSTVIQEYIPDLIVNWISKQEIYAEDVGLIYKENVMLIYNQDAVGAEIIDSGIKYYQHLIEYGEE